MADSKNNPDNRNKNTNIEKWVQVIGVGKRKMCKVIGDKLIDKQGKVISLE